MGVGFFVGLLVIIGIVIYLNMYNKKRHWHLDKNGVLKEGFIGSYCFLDAKKEDFMWMEDSFKKAFPEGYCTIKEHGSYARHILIVNTSLYHHQYFIREENSDDLIANGWSDIMHSIYYVERTVDEDRYYLYLRRPCRLGDGQENIIFKGRVVEGTISDLKRGFEEWQRDQKVFVEKHQDQIQALKNQILAKQKEYDSQVYKFPEY